VADGTRSTEATGLLGCNYSYGVACEEDMGPLTREWLLSSMARRYEWSTARNPKDRV